MDFAYDDRTEQLRAQLQAFMDEHVFPAEKVFAAQLAEAEADGRIWQRPAVIDELKAQARRQGLWNLFLAHHPSGAGLSNLQYAPLAEITGHSPAIAPEALNCAAPDTGNMELLAEFGNEQQQERWLKPLLDGTIRSAFCMTEPDVASSDATNMEATAVIDGDEVVINGRKWWSTGVGHPDCQLLIFMGLTDPDAHRYARHTMVLVPRDTPGVKVERLLPAMHRYDEPHGHGEVSFTNVRVPASNILMGPGRAFEIAQGRLGPGRVHHCMRLIGLAEKALELALQRGTSRTAFGKPLVNLGGNRERIADARIAINQARLLVLQTAYLLDTEGLAGALSEVSQIKVAVPRMAQDVIDMAMQLHGGGGLSDDFPLAAAWTSARALRLADGPDEVHRGVIARIELASYLSAAQEAK